jgi:hypothetical protein
MDVNAANDYNKHRSGTEDADRRIGERRNQDQHKQARLNTAGIESVW